MNLLRKKRRAVGKGVDEMPALCKNFEVLNNGGGVIFSKNPDGTLRVTDPRVYQEADGTFVLDETVDFDLVDKKLAQEKSKALKFLREALDI